MPMYTYTCVTCGEETDRIVKLGEREDQRCETCGGTLQREEIAKEQARMADNWREWAKG